MTYCQICQKHYRVINSSHLFSTNHMKQLRHIQCAIEHYKEIPEYNQKGITHFQNIGNMASATPGEMGKEIALRVDKL